jgi:hypothetical protein
VLIVKEPKEAVLFVTELDEGFTEIALSVKL